MPLFLGSQIISAETPGIVDVTDYGAVMDGVTNNDDAVRAAAQRVCDLAQLVDGWNTNMPTLYFPPGQCLLTEAGVLDGPAGLGYRKGYNIRGAGYLQTEILWQGPGYLMTNGDTDGGWWAFSYVEDISIRGDTTNSFWRILSRAGAPQANRFRRAAFTELVDCVTVDYGTANYNADLFRFDLCKATHISGHVFGIVTAQNSQSMVHSFTDCDFESIEGTILYFKSGGSVEVRGGSWIVSTTGRIIHCEDPTMQGIGSSNNKYTFRGTKFEWQNRDSDMTRAPLAYVESIAWVHFDSCNFKQLDSGYSGSPYEYVKIVDMGKVAFDNCVIPNNFAFRITQVKTVDNGPHRPIVLFDRCIMATQVGTMFVPENTTTLLPTVAARDCINATTGGDGPIDVTLFQKSGKSNVQPRRVRHYMKGTGNLPIGALVHRISAAWPAGTSGTGTVTVVHNGTTLLSASLGGTLAAEMSRDITAAARGLTITSTGTAFDYIAVDYS